MIKFTCRSFCRGGIVTVLMLAVPGCSLSGVSAITGAAQPGKTVEDAKDEAKRRLKRQLGEFEIVLKRAQASGRVFPRYKDWINSLASAVGKGLRPESLEIMEPFSSSNQEGARLMELTRAAQLELTDFFPPLPEGRDLETIAAVEEMTRPIRLTRAVIASFGSTSPSVRSAASALLSENYMLPS